MAYQSYKDVMAHRTPQGALYCAGLNAHGQLYPSLKEDVKNFELLLHSTHPVQVGTRLLFAGWSETVFISDSQVLRNGITSPVIDCPCDPNTLTIGFGDYNGLLGAMDTEGKLYLLESSKFAGYNDRLVHSLDKCSARISQIALCSNNHVSIALAQAPHAKLANILEFSSFDHFTRWRQVPHEASCAPSHNYLIPGVLLQLVATATGFAALTRINYGSESIMGSNEVYTWGSNLHSSLGRPITDRAPAAFPSAVPALAGLKIDKIAAGGWRTAALAKEDGALYVWGAASLPGSSTTAGHSTAGQRDKSVNGSIACLDGLNGGEVALVQFSATNTGTGAGNGDVNGDRHVDGYGEEDGLLDVKDVAIGTDHILALTTDGTVWGVGSNEEGQLGLSSLSLRQKSSLQKPSLSTDSNTIFDSHHRDSMEWTHNETTQKAEQFYSEWTKVFDSGAIKIDAGPRCSFIWRDPEKMFTAVYAVDMPDPERMRPWPTER